MEGHDLSIAAVGVHFRHDPGALTVADEVPVLSLGVGKINEEPVAGNAKKAGDEALDDEDPAPAAARLRVRYRVIMRVRRPKNDQDITKSQTLPGRRDQPFA